VVVVSDFGMVVTKYYEGYNDEQLRRNALKWLQRRIKNENRSETGFRVRAN
jgi:hypothetical protein